MDNAARRIWIIDGAYLDIGQKFLGTDYRFDYIKLRSKLEAQGGRFSEAYYFDAVRSPPSPGQTRFHHWMRSAPPMGPKIQVKLYSFKPESLHCENCQHETVRFRQKRVDIGIATLAFALADRYDTLVLSAGDGDFVDMVEHLRRALNKRIELAAFQQSASTELQCLSDHAYWIETFREDVVRGNPAGKSINNDRLRDLPASNSCWRQHAI